MQVNAQHATPRRVLIIKPSALGDVVTAIPVLRGLRRTFGQSLRIDWLLSRSCAQLLAGESQLDGIVEFDRHRYGRMAFNVSVVRDFLRFCQGLRQAGYDWVIDLQGLFRSGLLSRVTGAAVRAGFELSREGAALFYTHRLPAEQTPAHTVDRNIALAQMLGIDARPTDYHLNLAPQGQRWAAGVKDRLGGPFLLIAPATRWKSKRYPAHHWRAVIESLRRRLPIVLVAAAGEAHLTAPLAGAQGVLDLAGQTSLPQLAGLVAAARGVVCCDSAIMHIAAAVGVPQVTLIGPTDPARTGPYGRGAGVLRAALPCAGCRRRRCRHAACMESILPAAVTAAVQRHILEGPP